MQTQGENGNKHQHLHPGIIQMERHFLKKTQPGPGRCMRGGRKATFQKEVCVSY